jgi:hypothetical protein
MPVGIPATSALSMLVRKKNFVDDMYYTISVEDITVGHSGIVHLKYGQGRVEGVGEQSSVGNV